MFTNHHHCTGVCTTRANIVMFCIRSVSGVLEIRPSQYPQTSSLRVQKYPFSKMFDYLKSILRTQ